MSDERLDAPNLFALLTSGRGVDLDRILYPISTSEDQNSSLPAADRALLETAVLAINSETSRGGARTLATIAADEANDLARRTGLTLFTVAIFCELDWYDTALNEINDLLSALEAEPQSADRDILVASVTQQKALRLLEAGVGTGEIESRRVVEILSSFNSGSASAFALSESVGWDSTSTIAAISETLQKSAESFISSIEGIRSNSWADIIKSPPGILHLKQERQAAFGYREYMREAYRTAVGNSGIRFTTSSFGDSDIYSNLLAAELSGHPQVRGRRTDLGILRFLKSLNNEDGVDWLRADAIRLFVQARDTKLLKQAIRFTRSHGPLRALQAVTQDIASQRVTPMRLGLEGLAVLSGGASLLHEEMAQSALATVFTYIDQPPPSRPGSWHSLSSVLEDAWDAAVALAEPAGSSEQVALKALSAVEAERTPDELLDRAYARTLNKLDWRSLGNDTRGKWASWLTSEAATGYPVLRETLSPSVGNRYQQKAEMSVGGASSLAPIAAALNDSLVNAIPIDNVSFELHRTTVIDSLQQIRSSAAQGVFGASTYSAGDIAAGLAIAHQDRQLWTSLVEFLVDFKVQRDDKAGALERIARDPEAVPRYAVSALRQNSDTLLRTPASPFRPAPDLFPAALRVLSALNLIEEDELLSICLDLISSNDSLAHAEVARTISTIVRSGSAPQWASLFALQLSTNSDASTRAEAGRVLALLLDKPVASSAVAERRLIDLLNSDGLLQPITILRTIRGLPRIPAEVRDSIIVISQSHRSSTVRSMANAVLQPE